MANIQGPSREAAQNIFKDVRRHPGRYVLAAVGAVALTLGVASHNGAPQAPKTANQTAPTAQSFESEFNRGGATSPTDDPNVILMTGTNAQGRSAAILSSDKGQHWNWLPTPPAVVANGDTEIANAAFAPAGMAAPGTEDFAITYRSSDPANHTGTIVLYGENHGEVQAVAASSGPIDLVGADIQFTAEPGHNVYATAYSNKGGGGDLQDLGVSSVVAPK